MLQAYIRFSTQKSETSATGFGEGVGDGASTELLLVCSARVLHCRVTVTTIVTKCYQWRDP